MFLLLHLTLHGNHSKGNSVEFEQSNVKQTELKRTADSSGHWLNRRLWLVHAYHLPQWAEGKSVATLYYVDLQNCLVRYLT